MMRETLYVLHLKQPLIVWILFLDSEIVKKFWEDLKVRYQQNYASMM